MLLTEGVVYYQELAHFFPEVSTMTLRRDIESLVLEGAAIRIKNGARQPSSDEESAKERIYERRQKENIDIKVRMAKAALPFIEEGRSIYLDAGTTMLELVKFLPDIHLNIISSCPQITLKAIEKENCTVNIVGGSINRDNCAISGAAAVAFIKDINIDTAFLVPSGYSGKSGLTVGNYLEAELKRTVIKKADKVIILLGAYKTARTMPFTFASLKDVDCVITDLASNLKIGKSIKKKIQVITV